MTFKFSEFSSIGQDQVVKLREAGIESTDDMLRMWADQPNRESLAKKVGVGLKQLESYTSMARLARVKNVGPRYVEVLLAAGVDGPKSLFEYTPETLVKRLGEVTAEKKLTSAAPTIVEVGAWFLDAKPVAVAAK